jgi:uncharacterized membrane protein YgcG
MATGPDLRVGDADREAAAASLREHYAQGRLTLEEFNQRIDAAFAAVTQSQLHRVTRDLPHVAMPSPALPVATAGAYRERARREHPQGSRPRLRVLTAFATVIVAWLLVLSLLLPDLRHFPLPGKLGILLAIFAMVRGLMRRILGGGRGRGGRCGYSGGGHHQGWGSSGGTSGPWR